MAVKAFGAVVVDSLIEPIEIRIQDVDPAHDRRQRSTVKYRFVINTATLKGRANEPGI